MGMRERKEEKRHGEDDGGGRGRKRRINTEGHNGGKGRVRRAGRRTETETSRVGSSLSQTTNTLAQGYKTR